jgi:hypothetical protein
MRKRPVGGYEPDDREQHELSELWHTSRTAIAGREAALIKLHGSERSARVSWVVDAFLVAHEGEPNVKFKWVYVWCVEYLGRHVDPNPVPYGPDVFDGEPRTARKRKP